MPKSKRNKQVSLTQVKKKGRDAKDKLIQEARNACDTYSSVYLLSVKNFRTEKMQEIREQWKPSRFLFGKTSVMALALGKSPKTEYKKNLHEIACRLSGNSCLLFTDEPKDKVLEWFESFSSMDYARGGDLAPETITLDAGPCKQFSHSIEPHLRSLGLPTSLDRGVVTLIKDHTVCTEGKALTSDEANILKLFGIQLAEFKLTVDCVWSKAKGRFEEFVPRTKIQYPSENERLAFIEKKKQEKSKKRKREDVNEDEEVEDEDEDEDEDVEMEDDTPKKKRASKPRKQAAATVDDAGSDGEGDEDSD